MKYILIFGLGFISLIYNLWSKQLFAFFNEIDLLSFWSNVIGGVDGNLFLFGEIIIATIFMVNFFNLSPYMKAFGL